MSTETKTEILSVGADVPAGHSLDPLSDGEAYVLLKVDIETAKKFSAAMFETVRVQLLATESDESNVEDDLCDADIDQFCFDCGRRVDFVGDDRCRYCLDSEEDV